MAYLSDVIRLSIQNEQILDSVISDIDEQIRKLQQRRKHYVSIKHEIAKKRLEEQKNMPEILLTPFKNKSNFK